MERAAQRVMADVLDRADEVSALARESDEEPVRAQSLERAIKELSHLLIGRTVRSGVPASFDPQEVSRSAWRLIEAVDAVRAALRPRLTCDVRAVLRSVAYGAGLGRDAGGEGGLRADRRIAVRASDLARAIEGVVGEIEAAGGSAESRIGKPSGAHGPRGACVMLRWTGARNMAEEFVGVADSLRPLRCYGAEIEIEASRDGSGSARIELPAASDHTRPRSARDREGQIAKWQSRRVHRG
jgi:hypothetical protein